MLARKFKEKVDRATHKVDYTGASMLTVGCSLLILGLLEGGVAWGWGSVPSVSIFAGSLVLLVTFAFVERKATEPVLPLWVFSRRTLVGGNLMALVVGALMMGLTSYLPTYVQGVLGTGALVAGFALAALTVGWPISASLAGKVYMRIGFRDTALIGSGIIVIGAVLTAMLTQHAQVWQAAAASFVLGLGLGLASSPTVVAVQSTVGWERRGVVTATNMFSRSLGSAVGAAVFGAIANATLSSRFANPPADVAGHLPDSVDATSLVLGGQAAEHTPTTNFVQTALFDATHHVFLASVAVAVLGFVALLVMPRRTEQLTFV
jgi:Na+/melibiose symporter-like transporter